MFETRSHAWKEVGLLRQISPRVVKRARVEALLLVPLFVGVVILFENRVSLIGPSEPKGKTLGSLEAPIQIVTVLLLVILGWAIARDVGRALGPPLFRRLDPATAGTVGFLIRLTTVVVALVVALNVAGGDLWARRPADARQRDRGDRAAQRAAIPRRRARAAAGRWPRRADRGDRQLAGAAVHDVRERR
jgi:hypothetical protein